jgi:hypothetical protein
LADQSWNPPIYYLWTVGRPQRPYDLLWPVAKRRSFAVQSGAKVTEDTGNESKATVLVTPKTSPTPNVGTFEDLRDYAHRLLVSFSDPTARLPAEAFSPLRSDLERELEREEDGALTGCREAVEILTRNPQKGGCVLNCWGILSEEF